MVNINLWKLIQKQYYRTMVIKLYYHHKTHIKFSNY